MINLNKLTQALTDAGLVIKSLEGGRLVKCQTIEDKKGQQSGWYRLFENATKVVCVYGDWRLLGGRGVWVSGADSYQTPSQRADVQRLIKQAQIERKHAQAKQWAVNLTKLMKLWNETAPISEHDAVAQYLDNRGLMVPNTTAIRAHAGLDYWYEGQCLGTFPAMIGAITSPSGALVSIHRTYLSADGHKAPVPTVKKLCASAGPLMGASIKISTHVSRANEHLSIGISEGIETALAATMLFGIPTWAGVSAHGLANFEPPPNVKNIYIFGDNDASHVGQDAAAKLAQRLTHQGHIVRVHTPAIICDWCDELAAMGATV